MGTSHSEVQRVVPAAHEGGQPLVQVFSGVRVLMLLKRGRGVVPDFSVLDYRQSVSFQVKGIE